MKRIWKVVILGCLGTLILSGCGNAGSTVSRQDAAGSTQSEELSATVEEPGSEDAAAENETEGITEIQAADVPMVYGNSMGNIYNAGLLLTGTDGFFYFYNSYEDAVFKTDQATGFSVRLGDGAFTHLNRVGNKVYGILESGSKKDGSIVEMDLSTGKYKVFQKGNYTYLLAAENELYYLDADNSCLSKLDLESKKETVLVSEPVYGFDVTEDRVYFRRDEDEGYLYSVSREGGEITQINQVSTITPMIYENRIYYIAKENGRYDLRSSNLDGTEEAVLLENIKTKYSNLYKGVWYFIDENQNGLISYIDLSDGTGEVQTLDLTEALFRAWKDSKRKSFAEYQLLEVTYLNFSGDYMLFLCSEQLDEIKYTNEYLYNMTSGEIVMLATFCTEE